MTDRGHYERPDNKQRPHSNMRNGRKTQIHTHDECSYAKKKMQKKKVRV